MRKYLAKIGLYQKIVRSSFNKLVKNTILKTVTTNKKESIYVQSVGLLFNGDDTEQLNASLEFGEHLSNKRLKVSYLSYLPLVKYPELLKTAVYTDKDIKWNGIPTGEAVDHFINMPFDLLISTASIEELHFEYILATSIAKIKVGSTFGPIERLNVIVDIQNINNYEQFYLRAENILNSICPITK